MNDLEANSRVEELFALAAELPVAEQAAYLDEACAGDQPLRARVEKLLAADARLDGFMKRPTVELDGAGEPPEAGIGSMIGPYRLLQRIGEGGFGVVYMAEQQAPVVRHVALKIIKLGMDTRHVIARFEAERQMLAALDHPNIAKVLDAGTTENGRPYIVMELIKGVFVTDFCDQRSLSIRDRLRLFLPICRAVAHAHQKGVIHRDLKPSNVLVAESDDGPVPKIIDFGIAKVLDDDREPDARLTQEFQLLGSPAFMSPEQACGSRDLDVRTDVYSLGALFYQLVSGRTPIEQCLGDHQTPKSLLRIVQEKDPAKPSTAIQRLPGDRLTTISKQRSCEANALFRQLRGDLDCIALTALQRDRERRYPSPLHLAEDVENFLENRVVRARPPSLTYTARRFVARNRIAVAASILVLLSLGAAVTTLIFGYRAVSLQAEKSEVLAQSLFDVVFTGSALKGFTADYTVREMLLDLEGVLRQRLAAHPDLEARVLAKLGQVLLNNGEYSRALQTFSRVEQLSRSAYGTVSEQWIIPASLLAHSYGMNKEYSRAIEVAQEVLNAAKAFYGPDHPETLRATVRLAYFIWQDSADDDSRVAMAVDALTQVAAACETQNSPEYSDLLLLTYQYLTKIGLYQQDFLQAEVFARKRLGVAQRSREEARATHLILSKKLWAEALIGQREFEAAEALLNQILADTVTWHGAQSPYAADDQLDLGRLYLAWGKYDIAEQSAQKALQIAQHVVGTDPQWGRRALEQLRDIYQAMGDAASTKRIESEIERWDAEHSAAK